MLLVPSCRFACLRPPSWTEVQNLKISAIFNFFFFQKFLNFAGQKLSHNASQKFTTVSDWSLEIPGMLDRETKHARQPITRAVILMTIVFSLGVLHRGFLTAFIFAHCFLRVRPKMCDTWQSLHSQLHTRVPCPSSRALGLGLDGDFTYLLAFRHHYPLVEPKAIELQFRVIESTAEERLLLVVECLFCNYNCILWN